MSGWSAVHSCRPLPALYLLALTWLASGALRRWFDPVPRRVTALAVALVGVLFAPVLCGDAVLLPLDVLRLHPPFQQLPASTPSGIALQRDLVHQVAPWELAVKRALAGGGWPLWNPLQGAGMPLLADPQAQAFQPLVAIAYPFPPWAAVGLTAALKVELALLFTFLLLRRQRLGEAAAAAGAAAYALSGFLLLWLGWPIATCAALLPVALYAVARCDECGGRRDQLLLAAATAALLLAGHPETLVYCLGFVALFLLDRCRARWRGGAVRSWRGAAALAARAGVAMGLAAALTAPVLLPTLAYLPQTQRSAIVAATLQPIGVAAFWRTLGEPEALARWRRRARLALVPAVAPDALGDARWGFWGNENYIQDTGEFAGTATLLLALLDLVALALPAAAPRRPQERLAGVVLAGSFALLAQPSELNRLLVRLPLVGLTATHHQQRIQVLATFCLCWLAACQLDRWQRGELGRRRLAAGGAAVAALVAWGTLGNGNPHAPAFAATARLASMEIQLLALAAAVACLALGCRHRHRDGGDSAAGAAPGRKGRGARIGRLAHAAAPWLLVAVTAGELVAFYRDANPPNEARLAYPEVPAVRFLAAHLGSDRMVGTPRVLPPNFGSVFGLNDVRIDNPAGPRAYQVATGFLDHGGLEPLWGRFGHPLYRFLGVRYLIARPGLALPFPRVHADPAASVWELPDPLPRLFLPDAAEVSRTADVAAWLDANPDFAHRALVDAAPGDRPWQAGRPDDSRLGPITLGATRVHTSGLLVEPRLLASSLYQDGGWRVLAGGAPLRPLRVDGAFAGAWLPVLPGGRPLGGAVDLLYRPAAHLWGCLLAALALAAGTALWLPPPARPDDRPDPAIGATRRSAQTAGDRAAAGRAGRLSARER